MAKVEIDFAKIKFEPAQAAELYKDAISFLKDAKKATHEASKRYARATVALAAAAFEASLNFHAYFYAAIDQELKKVGKATRWTESELDCLLERRPVLQNGQVLKVFRQYPLLERFQLLVKFESGGKKVAQLNAPFQDLKKAVDLRNELLHPKPKEKPMELGVETAESALNGFLQAEWERIKVSNGEASDLAET